MKPATFEYHAPDSVEEALALLREHGWDAKALAGGQSLIPAMNFRIARPTVLVDLNRIDELAFIRRNEDEEGDGGPGPGGVRIGAMTRQRAVERSGLVAECEPLLTEMMPHVAHLQIRNRGTFGGSAVHADPASEIPAALLALNASCRVRGPEGERWVRAEEFFLGLFGTSLEPDELLMEIAFPGPRQRMGIAFREIARRHGDYALAGLATRLALDVDGRIQEVRLAYLGVGGAPALATSAAAALVGEKPTATVVEEAARTAAEELEPMEDMHASAAYRSRLVEVLTREALGVAAERASNSV
ncbi:MAG: xanthine dehydrogenase family protein subunit M [Gemmatimonadales bacterium]